MKTAKAVIKNKMGIHVRPSGEIIAKTQSYSGTIFLKSKDLELQLNSIMDLLALGLQEGDELEISVTGPDEEIFVQELVELFQYNYDFSPQ